MSLGKLDWTKDLSYEEIASRYPSIPESEEVYDYERGAIPASDLIEILEVKGQPQQLSRKQLTSIAKDELRRLGYGNTQVRITKSHGDTPEDMYADATACPITDEDNTITGRGVKLHPSMLYNSPDYVREVIQHEVTHLKDFHIGDKWKK